MCPCASPSIHHTYYLIVRNKNMGILGSFMKQPKGERVDFTSQFQLRAHHFESYNSKSHIPRCHITSSQGPR